MWGGKQPEPKDLDGSLPGLDRYIRRLYSSSSFPCVDGNGGGDGTDALQGMFLTDLDGLVIGPADQATSCKEQNGE